MAIPDMFTRRFGCKRWVKSKAGEELVKPNVFYKFKDEKELSYYEAPPDWGPAEWAAFQETYRMNSGDLPGLLKLRPADFQDSRCSVPNKTLDLTSLGDDPFANLHWETPIFDDERCLALSERATQRLKLEGLLREFVEH